MSQYSYENGDEAPFRAHNPSQPTQHHQSARGRGGYSVSSGTAYLPPREPAFSPGSELHYGGSAIPATQPHSRPQMDERPGWEDQRQGRTDHDRTGQRTLIDSSPQRLQQSHIPTPPVPRHRDHDGLSAPPPPPHQNDANYEPPLGAAGALTGGAMGMAADTGYHGAHGHESRDANDPFQDHAAVGSLRTSPNAYPEYSTGAASHDPFTQHANPAVATPGPAIGMAGSDSYEMRPPLSQRPSSYTDPYGHGWLNDSQGDLGSFDPRDIADDEDDAAYLPTGRKTAAAGTGAAIGGGAMLGSRDASGKYGQVPGADPEKTARLKSQGSSGRRTKWMVGSVIAFIIIFAVIGSVVGGVLYSNNAKKSAAGGGTADDDGPDMDKDSAGIKALMNNPDLHRIFPGMDYNPFNGQYPGCLTWPPSQNNVTKDVAVLSQLTPKIRLYGTDCNQTEMVLHAIDKLDMKDSLKVWLGVYLDGNSTTRDRQLSQMWKILDDHGQEPFAGLIVGNEVLFSEYMSESQLIDLIDNVRQNLTSKGINFPLATSDLGSNWKPYPNLVQAVDIVMGNVHPFFGGVEALQAASWTNTYFEDNDVSAARAASSEKKALVAEVGWPSTGGNYCTDASTGKNVTCASPTAGAVAGTAEMNRFLQDWACPALDNGTDYFWFEAFDEPWKVRFNYPGAEWETEWGLMDIGRKIKPGLKIPDCGGKTAN